MADNVVYLQKPPREIAQYLRVGFHEHRQCEHLISAGKIVPRRFVIEAANFERQASLIRILRDEGAEIVIDTNAAELSVAGRFSGSASSAPWATFGRRLEADDFFPGTNRSVIDPIARFAVENRVSAVMAPSHYLGEHQDHWLDIDIDACVALRRALDRLGAAHIEIDYPLILAYAQLRDPEVRERLVERLQDAPFSRLWLRTSGFGADATGAGIERYVQGVFSFHKLRRPIISDQVGGLASLAVCAFGASSGFAHGTEGKERFSADGWVEPKKKSKGGGGGKTIYIPAIDRRLKIDDARKLFDDARTAREIFGCPDRSCCGDIDSMLKNPEAHFLVQKERQVRDLSSTPESLRTDRFLTEHLEQSRRKAVRATRLKKADDEIREKLTAASKRLDRVEEALVKLHERIGIVEFSEEAKPRSGYASQRMEPSRHSHE